jgi:hypothetical protein
MAILLRKQNGSAPNRNEHIYVILKAPIHYFHHYKEVTTSTVMRCLPIKPISIISPTALTLKKRVISSKTFPLTSVASFAMPFV